MTRWSLATVSVALLLTAGAPTPASAATPAPCIDATTACTEWVAVGGGSFRSMIYRSYSLETRNEAITRVLIMVHGAGRDADNYYRTALAAGFLAGALDNTLIIAPHIVSNEGSCKDQLAPNEVSYNCSSWRSGGAAINDPNVTSFDFLDAIMRKVADKSVFPNLKLIVIAGHSAGGQVVNRYEMTNRVNDNLGVPIDYVVANPSSYAWPSNERPTEAAWTLTANPPGYIPEVRDGAAAFRANGEGRGCTAYDQWPYGLENRSGYSASESDAQIKQQLVSRHTTYLLGQIDILPLGGFDGSCSAMAQGPTRQARGQAFHKYVNEKLGAHHEMIIVPECGHDARCMFTDEGSLPVIFPKQ